ncbi:GntR family transcriptional regulator / MocR family aminotransferase [Lachnospiraceae bacterium XBB1006]|nr:GntR family transcriptional regulator / MocR family aminotransferase [Lachnospiraceae bacterium XBB1006]
MTRLNKSPAYLTLYRSLVHDIVSGIYPYGSKLPSKRVLAAQTGLSVITVSHALTLLSEEGYVQSRERSGVFVTYRGEDFLGNITLSLPPLLHEDNELREIGNFPFSVLAKTMRRVLLDYGEEILTKSDNSGCPRLRDEICLYLARSRGITVSPAQIIVGSGAEYLYSLIAQFLGTGERIAIENPSYEKIHAVYTAMGLSCDLLTMTPEGLSSIELDCTDAIALHVTPFNSFPSGVTAGISKKMEYLRWAKKRNRLLIEDNYDSELTVSKKMEEPLFSMENDVQVIYLNTFSRTIAPSMRIGYMILPPSLVEPFHNKLGFYSCTVPVFEQYVLAELLKSGDFERHINRIRRQRRR